MSTHLNPSWPSPSSATPLIVQGERTPVGVPSEPPLTEPTKAPPDVDTNEYIGSRGPQLPGMSVTPRIFESPIGMMLPSG